MTEYEIGGVKILQRDLLLATGVVSVLAARHFYRAKQLWPFRATVFLAWPTLGVAIMETVISNSAPKNVQQLATHKGDLELEKTRQDNAAFLERMRQLAANAKQ